MFTLWYDTEEERRYHRSVTQTVYDEKNTVQFKMKLNKKTDADVIDWLKQQRNKQGSIKTLIRAAIAAEGDKS